MVSCVVHAALIGVISSMQVVSPRLSDSDSIEGTQTTLDLVPAQDVRLKPEPIVQPPQPQPQPEPPTQPVQPTPPPVQNPEVTSIERPAPTLPDPRALLSKNDEKPETATGSEFFEQTSMTSSTPLTHTPPSTQNITIAPASIAGVRVERASKVTYAVDISGAMTTSLEYVKRELLASLARLAPGQAFRIVLFCQPPGETVPQVTWFDSNYVDVSQESRIRAVAWISAHAVPSGKSVPLAGLRAALSSNVSDGELMFFMTRSIVRSGTAWGEGKSATVNELERLNPPDANGKRRVVIKALQFIDDDSTGLLQTIGALHGDGPGSYRVIVPR